jgi:HlyD family secretion protein
MSRGFSSRSRRRRGIPRASLVLVALGGLLLVAACDRTAEAGASAVEPVDSGPAFCVETVAVEDIDLRPEVDVPANALPSQQVVLFAKVPGEIVEIAKRKGDPVAAGEVLFRIARDDYEDYVRQAEAQLHVARTAASGMAGTLRTVRPQVERLEQLTADGVTPTAQLDALRTQYAQADTGTRSAQAQVQLAELGVEMAGKKLEDTVIRAPFDGVVAERLADVGAYAQMMPPTPVLAILDIDPVKVEGAIPELSFGRLDREAPVRIVFDAWPDDPVDAPIAAVMPALDPRSRTLPISVTIPNPEGRFRPGMAAVMRLPMRSERWRVVPRRALVGEPSSGSAVVFVIGADGAVEERRLRVLGQDEGRVRVEGVEPGTRVAVTGVGRLRGGMTVCVEGEAAAP